MISITIISDAASIIGLVFSFLAFLKARSASVAAIQAKQAIYKSSFADELALVCTSMDQLLDLLRHEHHLEAGIRADQLVLGLSELRFRRRPFLAEETVNELLNAREQLQILSGEMRRQQVSSSTQQRSMKAALATAMKLREELGKMKGNLDLEGQK
jgi:hypothetical protein